MTSHTGSARRILGILKKVELRLDTEREGLTFAYSRRRWAGVARDGWGGWQSQNRKNVYLSPYVEEPLNSKVIKKVSYLNWEVVSVFRVSRFLCFIYIYEHYMSISRGRIWLWYRGKWNTKKEGKIDENKQ